MYSSKDEVEIRAATILAVEEIMEEIKQCQVLSKCISYEYEVDWLLWQTGEENLS